MSKSTEIAKAPSLLPVEYHNVPTPETFEKAAQVIVEIHQSITKHSVTGYWLIGKMVHDMQENEGRYGTGITDRISEELSASGERISKRIIEEAHRAYKRSPGIEDINKLTDMGIGWSQIRAINKIGDVRTRKKTAQHIADKRLNARQSEQYVRDIMDSSKAPVGAAAPAKLPEGHPSAFFIMVDSILRKSEAIIDKSEKDLTTLATKLSDLAKDFDTNVARLSDPEETDDDQFGIACDACKSIGDHSGMLQDRLDLYQNLQTDLFQGIHNILKSRYSELPISVSWKAEEEPTSTDG